MTHPSTRRPICKLMLACDGNNLTANRLEKGYCGKCEEALAKKNKPPPPLKGANSALPKPARKLSLTAGWDANGSPVEDG